MGIFYRGGAEVAEGRGGGGVRYSVGGVVRQAANGSTPLAARSIVRDSHWIRGNLGQIGAPFGMVDHQLLPLPLMDTNQWMLVLVLLVGSILVGEVSENVVEDLLKFIRVLRRVVDHIEFPSTFAVEVTQSLRFRARNRGAGSLLDDSVNASIVDVAELVFVSIVLVSAALLRVESVDAGSGKWAAIVVPNLFLAQIDHSFRRGRFSAIGISLSGQFKMKSQLRDDVEMDRDHCGESMGI